jgi:hypothetical protein
VTRVIAGATVALVAAANGAASSSAPATVSVDVSKLPQLR